MGGGGVGQGEVLARVWEQLFSYVTHCINLIHIALRFPEDIPYGYRVGLHKNSLRNSTEGCNSIKMGVNPHRAHRRLLKEYFYKVLLKYLQWLGS